MGVHQLVYRSQATNAMSPGELERLLSTARLNNELDDNTGLLLYFGPEISEQPTFLQVLEGPEEGVERVFSHIARDGRHTSVSVIARGEVAARRFPSWTMGLEYVTLAHRATDLAVADGH